MKQDERAIFEEIARHPGTYGIIAAITRWALGDRDGGIRALVIYLVTSLVVAWGASLFLEDEALTTGRKGLYLLMLAFIAKDVLLALTVLAGQFAKNPLEAAQKIRSAFRGGDKQ